MSDTDPAVIVWRCAWWEHVTRRSQYRTHRPTPDEVLHLADFDTEHQAEQHAVTMAKSGRLIGEAAIYQIPIHQHP